MKGLQLKYLAGLLLLLFNISCEKEEPVALLAVDSVIRIEMAESSREGGSSEFALVFTTVKEYPCLGYVLVGSKEAGEQELRFSFSGIKPPQEGCLTATGPAMAIMPLGQLTNGVYELAIYHDNFSGRGTLEVKDEEIILDFTRQEGILVPDSSLSR